MAERQTAAWRDGKGPIRNPSTVSTAFSVILFEDTRPPVSLRVGLGCQLESRDCFHHQHVIGSCLPACLPERKAMANRVHLLRLASAGLVNL